MKNVEFLKTKGIQLFKENNYQSAFDYFSEAILFLENGIEKENKKHIDNYHNDILITLYSNRSNCLINLLKYDDALHDAKTCVKLNKFWLKGHLRCAVANFYLKNFEDWNYSIKIAYDLAISENEKNEISFLINQLKKQISFSDKLKYFLKDTTEEENKIEIEFQNQVDWLMSQYIKPHEDDAFRSLAIYHNLNENCPLSKHSAKLWRKFGIQYGSGDSPDLMKELEYYLDLLDESEIKLVNKNLINLTKFN